MELDDAKNIVSSKYPNFKIVYGVPYKDIFVFRVIDKKTGRTPLIGGSITVNNDGKTGIFNPINYDVNDFNKNFNKNVVYYSSETIDAIPVEVINE